MDNVHNTYDNEHNVDYKMIHELAQTEDTNPELSLWLSKCGLQIVKS